MNLPDELSATEALDVLIWVYHSYDHAPTLKDLYRLRERMTGEPYLHNCGTRDPIEEPE